MKKGTIIALIVATALVVSGGLLVTVGLSYAGNADYMEPGQVSQEAIISEPFDSVKINTKDCDVTFTPFNGEANAQVTVTGEPESVSHSIQVEDGILKIEMTDERKWTDHIGIFQLFDQSESMEMTVYLPAVPYDFLHITTETGDVQIPGVLEAREVLVRAATGDVWLEGGPIEVLDCMVSTGTITVRGGEAESMKLRTVTGRLDIRGVNAQELHLGITTGKTQVEDVEVTTFTHNGSTGDVKLKNVKAEEYLQVFTTTGEVEVTDSTADTVNIQTTTGAVTVPAAWEFQRIETTTGNIHFE